LKTKKIQTTIKTSGKTSAMELGWVDSTRLGADFEEERQRFSRLALMAEQRNRPDRTIQTVETAGNTIVVVYESGEVRIVNYIPEEEI
jgi:hypothetical protein